MKKLLLTLCLAFLSVGVFAADAPKAANAMANFAQASSVTTTTTTPTSAKEQARFGCYNATTSCGTVWEICGDAPIEIHMLMWDLIEAACGTDIDYIEISY